MIKSKLYPLIQVLLAALLFGASAPLSKILLGQIEPIPLASLLYMGSGIGLFLFQSLQSLVNKNSINEAPLTKKDIPWLIGAVLAGGVIAPIILMTSLKITPASTASLLLNFEGVATTIIAYLFFKENVGKRIWIGLILITLASITLSWDYSNQWGLSIGALGIIAACFCWGIDNNFTRNISSKNPYTIVIIKGLGAGFFSLLLAILLKIPFPNVKIIINAMLLGFFSYGFSIVLFVLSMRSLGSARTSAFFSTAPFIGTILSFALTKDVPDIIFIASFTIMIIGTILLFKENHSHKHIHEYIEHEHRHRHDDNHHNHTHENGEILNGKYHSHMHIHEYIEHEHPHTPDIHHRHAHNN